MKDGDGKQFILLISFSFLNALDWQHKEKTAPLKETKRVEAS